MTVKEINPTQFVARRAADAPGAAAPVVLVDVREDWELQIAPPPAPFVHIPLGQLESRVGELDPTQDTVVICRSGARSLRAAQYLAQNGFGSVFNLTGGILAWSRDVDPSIPSY